MKRTIRFQLDGNDYQVEVERNGDRLTVSREGESFTVSLLDSPAQAPASAGASSRAPVSPARPATTSPRGAAPPAAKTGVLYAPMTGLVKEVKVAVGSRVARGEVVLVMEAMKMDVEVSAPATGVVAEVHASAGQTVESQAPLLVIRD